MTVFGVYGFLVLIAVGSLFYLSNEWTRNAWLAIAIGKPPDGFAPRSRRVVELYREHLFPVSWSLRLLHLTTPLGIYLVLEDLNAYILEEFGVAGSFLGLNFSTVSAMFGIFAFAMAMDSLWKEIRTKRKLISERSG